MISERADPRSSAFWWRSVSIAVRRNTFASRRPMTSLRSLSTTVAAAQSSSRSVSVSARCWSALVVGLPGSSGGGGCCSPGIEVGCCCGSDCGCFSGHFGCGVCEEGAGCGGPDFGSGGAARGIVSIELVAVAVSAASRGLVCSRGVGGAAFVGGTV